MPNTTSQKFPAQDASATIQPPVHPPASTVPPAAARPQARPPARRFSDEELNGIRARVDLAALVQGCGVELKRAGKSFKACCPFHTEATPSFDVDPERGTFKCYGCGKQGDAFTFVMEHERVKFPEAVKRVAAFAGMDAQQRAAWPKAQTRPAAGAPKPVPEFPVPEPNREALERFVSRAITTLAESPELQARWLRKRGLSLETAGRFCLGFMPWSRFTAWPKRPALKDAWVLPIADAAGTVQGVKLHRENAPKGSPKCLWAPFGTQPDPRNPDSILHAFLTLWPAPEWWPLSERLYLCEGELKALAICEAGRAGISITGGSSWRWTPGQVARLAGRRVVIVYDDDPPDPRHPERTPAGVRFMQETVRALRGAVADLKVKTFGRKAVAHG